MTRELLQQALDALQWHYDRGYPDSPTDEPRKRDARAIRALRSALAAPQPEPVTFEQAWATYEAKGYQYGKDALEQVRFGWEIAHEFAIAAPPAAPAPAAPDLKHKPTVQRLMDLARKFRATPGDLYDGAYKELQQACYEALSAAPAVREPQDERIRWRDAVIKEAESALRTAEKEFADMPTWANAGHAAKKVTHALAVIAALGIGGGGNG